MLVMVIFAIIGMLAMGTGILYGLIAADFLGEGSQILSIPWGIITLIDIYISFLVFCGWIVFREKSVWKSILWVLFVLGLGSFTISLYLFIA